MKVLIFEKSKEVTTCLMELIKETGSEWQICNASSFTDAVMLLQINEPDIVFLDLHFSESLFISLLQLIKKKNKNIAVIIMYTYASLPELKHCLAMGADYFINKYDDFSKIPSIISCMADDKLYKVM